MQAIINKWLGKTEDGKEYTPKQALVAAWFSLSLGALCILAEGPIWLLLILLANFAASAKALKKIPVPADPEDDFYTDNNEDKR